MAPPRNTEQDLVSLRLRLQEAHEALTNTPIPGTLQHHKWKVLLKLTEAMKTAERLKEGFQTIVIGATPTRRQYTFTTEGDIKEAWVSVIAESEQEARDLIAQRIREEIVDDTEGLDTNQDELENLRQQGERVIQKLELITDLPFEGKGVIWRTYGTDNE
jgi:hypothetical protein